MNEFDFTLVGEGTDSPFGGYISEIDRTVVGRRFLVRGSKNVYRKKSGALANRPGLLLRGAQDTGLTDTKASFEWETSLGATRVLRVNNDKLQVESDIVLSGTYIFYDLLTLTNTRVIFDQWWDNTLKKDILLFCDGTDDMKSWSGGLGKIDSTTATTIVLTATVASQGFDTASGTVIINGTEYAYTGSSASTLTGVTPDPTGEANASVVLQKVTTDSNTVEADYEIDFIRVINNQLYAGSDTSRLVYISKNTDWDDFTKSSPRATGQGDTITLDELPTGIALRDGKAHIGTRKAWYEVSFEQITVSTDLTEQTKVKKTPLAPKEGLLRHEFIGNVGNDVVYLSEDQQLRVLATFRNLSEPKLPSLSEDIETELNNEDFTGGHLRAIGDFIYLTAPNNGRVWIHETQTKISRFGNIEKERIWYAPFIWNLSRIALINGVEYGYSNATPLMYQLWSTLQWHDDNATGESIPYDSMFVFGYRNDSRFNLISFDKMYIEGYMSQSADVRGAVAYEYKGERSVQSFVVNSEEENVTPEFYTGDIGNSLGDSSLGDNPLGDQTSDEEADQELLPKFRIMVDFEEMHVHEYQPRIYATEADSRVELLALGTNEIVCEEVSTVMRE